MCIAIAASCVSANIGRITLAVQFTRLIVAIQNASLSQANAWDSCGANCNFGPIPSWTSSGTGPTGSFQPTTSSYNAPLPGIIAYSNNGSISQTLTTTVQPNTTYTLLVDIGKRLESGLTADYSLALQAGSTVLATLRTSNANASPA